MSRAIEQQLVRLACRLAESAARNRRQDITATLRTASQHLDAQRVAVQRQQERVAKAIDRGWLAAAGRVLSDGRFDRDSWWTAWDRYGRAVDEFLRRGSAALTISHLHNELEASTEEFEHCDWDAGWLWVTTEPISLEDIDLGPFQIRLRLDRIGGCVGGDDFEVVAMRPNPARTNDEVTHPHVSSNRLCQGEAAGPIRLALEQGRLADFFHLVHSVLRTYNPGSPFVRLDEWDGVHCSDCGSSVAADNACYCESCGQDYCDECCTCCLSCDAVRCAACLMECRGCGDSFCGGCLSSCEKCGARSLCDSCLEDGLCPPCREAQALEEDDAHNSEGTEQWEGAGVTPGEAAPARATVSADAGVRADGVAEAAVPVPCR
jgi:hypothetical protein